MDTIHLANPSSSLDIPLFLMVILAFKVSMNTSVMWFGEDVLLAGSSFSDGGSYHQFFG